LEIDSIKKITDVTKSNKPGFLKTALNNSIFFNLRFTSPGGKPSFDKPSYLSTCTLSACTPFGL
jgi:hypothetical protein